MEKIIYNIAYRIGKNASKTEQEIQVINYGLFIVVHTTIGVILTIITGTIIKKPIEISIITFISATLKRYSGGVHATSAIRCLTIGIIVSIACTYLSTYLFNIGSVNITIIFTVITIFISFIIFYKNVPVGTKSKPLKNKEVREKLRKKLFNLIKIYYISLIISIILIVNGKINFSFTIYIYCINLGILLQTFSLTKAGRFIILTIDKFLINIKCKGE